MTSRYFRCRTRAGRWAGCLVIAAVLPIGSPSAQQADDDLPTPVPARSVTVRPAQSDDVLYNPGMGFADFHFGFGKVLPPEAYPRSTVAYFRWSWAELEPAEGSFNFDLVDRVIRQAKAKGESLAFRIMADYQRGTPQWLLDKGIDSVQVNDGMFPDYNNPVFLTYHEKLLRAFGSRYGASPDIDHIDIGSIGCWGEWNTACCEGVEAQCRKFFPSQENQIKITDWYFTHFSGRPLVMLHGGLLRYAAARGAGWRGDCFGDYGYFSRDWNHMEHAYPPALEDPVVAEAWKRGPVEFEVCGVMQDWYELHFDIDRILMKGLDWHVSVLNAKSSPVPVPWRSRVDGFLKRIGYRFVLREFRHDAEARPGESLLLHSVWDNAGVAPMYHRRPLAYRLRSDSAGVAARWISHADVRRWLPGDPVEVEDTVRIPGDLSPGRYDLDVAILDEEGRDAAVFLAIQGKREDRWYRISGVTISE